MFLCCCFPPSNENPPSQQPPPSPSSSPAPAATTPADSASNAAAPVSPVLPLLPPTSTLPGKAQGPLEDGEPSFTVLSDEELETIVAEGGQNGNGAPPLPTAAAVAVPAATAFVPAAAAAAGGGGGGGGAAATQQPPPHEEEEEAAQNEWDCHLTDLVTLTYPEGVPEGDPVKVNEYVLEGHLGAGAFGNVKKAKREVGEPPFQTFAIKIMSRHRLRRYKTSVMSGVEGQMTVKTGIDMMENEIRIMRHLYHRNVVLLFEVIDDPVEDSIFMIMEYLEGGPSMDYDKNTKRFTSPLTGGILPPPLAAKLFFGLVAGLLYLHAHGICHRDIKPENLLLTDGTKLRITDFGCAMLMGEVPVKDDDEGEEEVGEEEGVGGMLVDTAGTYTFLAPECCTGEAFSPWPVDVWAAGVTLYVFLFGRLPFQKEGLGPLFEAIQEEVVVFLPREEAGEEEGGEEGKEVMVLEEGLRDMLEGLFQKNPRERWTLGMLREHAWLETAQREDEEEDRRRDEAEEEEARREKEDKEEEEGKKEGREE